MNALLHVVLCIKCQSTLSQRSSFVVCTNKKCSQTYPYKNGILSMLPKQSLSDKQSKFQKEYYDMEYKKYDNNLAYEFQNRYMKRLYTVLPKKKGLVLDYASGQGYMTVAAAKKGHNVVACDISIVGLQYTYHKAKELGIEKNILLIAGDLNEISFKKNSFHFFIMTHVLEHFKNDKEIIQRLLATAKNQARFFISVPLSLKYVFYPLIPFYAYSDRQVGHLRRYTKERIIKLFKRSVKPVAIFYTGHLVKVFGALLNLLNIHGFDSLIEDLDEKQSHSKVFASVITVCLELKR